MTFYGDPTMVCALKHIKGMKTEGERRKFLDEFFEPLDEQVGTGFFGFDWVCHGVFFRCFGVLRTSR